MQTTFFFFFFSLFLQDSKQKTESCDPRIRMAAGSGMENIQALIPNVGEWGGRLCGRRITQCSVVEEEPAYGRLKATRYAQRERDTHTHTQRGITLLSKVCATVTNEQQPLQKVTKSLYIVTHLGQLPFILFT